MKIALIIVLFCYLAASPAGCNDKNVQPNFPTNLSAAQQTEYMNKWKEGEVLFKANCAKCHGVFNTGKDSIANFTSVQIDQYTTSFLAKDPKNHSIMQQISMPDFTKVVFFLTYLKRTNQQGPPPPLAPNNQKPAIGF